MLFWLIDLIIYLSARGLASSARVCARLLCLPSGALRDPQNTLKYLFLPILLQETLRNPQKTLKTFNNNQKQSKTYKNLQKPSKTNSIILCFEKCHSEFTKWFKNNNIISVLSNYGSHGKLGSWWRIAGDYGNQWKSMKTLVFRGLKTVWFTSFKNINFL